MEQETRKLNFLKTLKARLELLEKYLFHQDLVKSLRTLTYSLDPNLPPDPPIGMEL